MSNVINRKAFIFRLDHRLPVSLDHNVIGLGWYQAERLDTIKDWPEFKNILRDAYPDPYATNERSLGNAAGSIWRFMFDMSIGDYALVPADSAFYLAEIKGAPFYEAKGANDQDDFAWRRSVTWITPRDRPIPRSFANNSLQMRMKARQTCVDASDLLSEITSALNRTKPVTFTEFLLKSAYEPVSKALKQGVSNYGLEEIVRRLASARGAKAEGQSKNTGRPGDVDVIAYHDLKIGNQESVVKVAFQVKQHEGVSDEVGIQQLIDRMEHDPTLKHGCFVTTAAEVSKEARELAEANDIILVTEKELIEWIMMVGLHSLS